MAHDIQYLFDNISAKDSVRSIDIVEQDIKDLRYLMFADRRKMVLPKMAKKMEKLEVELDRAKKKVEAAVAKKYSQ